MNSFGERVTMGKLIYLEFVMLSPIVIMCVSLLYFDMYTLSVLLYNGLSLVILPLIYLRWIVADGQQCTVSYYLRNRFENARKQLIVGVIMFSVVYGVIMVNYDVCEHYFKREVIDQININFNKSYLNFAVLVFFFGIINPILEEWFWRNFIPQAFFDIINLPYNHSSQQRMNVQPDIEEAIPNQEINEDSQLYPLNDKQNHKLYRELFQMMFSLHYASYHFFVVLHVTNAIFAISATIIVAIAGRVFLFLNNKVGFISSSLTHMGADLAFCTLALVIFYNNKIL